ncbi:MAG: hypothetical protein RL072_321 [Actinomycetota bacterium]|jgi:anion-transporting  ArsA/GET3 family ATPase
MRLLDEAKMIIVCGPGGVGKTTSAAALGVVAATHSQKRVLVLTVDPAKRLATALGLESLGNVEVQVELRGAHGSLTMAMIDTKSSWDDMIRRHAPDATTRDRVLSNELYKTLTSRFVHSHDYVVTERLFDARESGKFDLVIVDTPPSRSALSVLDAPRRMQQFFGSRLLKLLTAPAQSRLLSIASRPFFLVADRILGAAFLSDISEFFSLFRSMEDPIAARAQRVASLLSEPATSYLVVTSAESVALNEARYLVSELRQRRHRLEAVLINRVMPARFAIGADRRAASLAGAPDDVRSSLSRVETEIAAIASHQTSVMEQITKWEVDVLVSEARNGDITNVESLLALGESIRQH